MKGKSTAAFGLALRGWTQGWSIGVFQFVKSAKWKVGEEAALRALGDVHASTGQGGPVTWNKMGEGWSWIQRAGSEADHAADAREGWEQIKRDLAAQTYHIEVWQKTPTAGWVVEGATTAIATQDRFGMGAVGTPPPNTQAAIGQAPACTDNTGAAIGNTGCVVFNSRGLPIDGAGAPTAANAYYITDGTDVFGITVAATGMVRTWRTPATAAPSWNLQ